MSRIVFIPASSFRPLLPLLRSPSLPACCLDPCLPLDLRLGRLRRQVPRGRRRLLLHVPDAGCRVGDDPRRATAALDAAPPFRLPAALDVAARLGLPAHLGPLLPPASRGRSVLPLRAIPPRASFHLRLRAPTPARPLGRGARRPDVRLRRPDDQRLRDERGDDERRHVAPAAARGCRERAPCATRPATSS